MPRGRRRAERGLAELHQEGLIFEAVVSIPKTKDEWLISLVEVAEELKRRDFGICEISGEEFRNLKQAIVCLLVSERHTYQKILLTGAYWISKKNYSAHRVYSHKDYIRDSIRGLLREADLGNDSNFYKFLDRGLPGASDLDPHP